LKKFIGLVRPSVRGGDRDQPMIQRPEQVTARGQSLFRGELRSHGLLPDALVNIIPAKLMPDENENPRICFLTVLKQDRPVIISSVADGARGPGYFSFLELTRVGGGDPYRYDLSWSTLRGEHSRLSLDLEAKTAVMAMMRPGSANPEFSECSIDNTVLAGSHALRSASARTFSLNGFSVEFDSPPGSLEEGESFMIPQEVGEVLELRKCGDGLFFSVKNPTESFYLPPRGIAYKHLFSQVNPTRIGQKGTIFGGKAVAYNNDGKGYDFTIPDINTYLLRHIYLSMRKMTLQEEIRFLEKVNAWFGLDELEGYYQRFSRLLADNDFAGVSSAAGPLIAEALKIPDGEEKSALLSKLYLGCAQAILGLATAAEPSQNPDPSVLAKIEQLTDLAIAKAKMVTEPKIKDSLDQVFVQAGLQPVSK
jgi:hypothetical protein